MVLEPHSPGSVRPIIWTDTLDLPWFAAAQWQWVKPKVSVADDPVGFMGVDTTGSMRLRIEPLPFDACFNRSAIGVAGSSQAGEGTRLSIVLA